jgi:hypothetical protein
LREKYAETISRDRAGPVGTRVPDIAQAQTVVEDTAVWLSEVVYFELDPDRDPLSRGLPWLGPAIRAFPAVDKATFEDVGGRNKASDEDQSYTGVCSTYSCGKI